MKYKPRFNHRAALQMLEEKDERGKLKYTTGDVAEKFQVSRQAIYDARKETGRPWQKYSFSKCWTLRESLTRPQIK
jgi:DNA-binding XRE family transcriptional regulator